MSAVERVGRQVIRLDVRVSNPLNGSQGLTRGGRMARVKERRRLREMAEQHLRTSLARLYSTDGSAALQPCVVSLVRIATRPLDSDGWQSGAKPIRDGVADYLGVPDNDPRVEWRYAQRKGRPREFAVEITLEPKGAA